MLQVFQMHQDVSGPLCRALQAAAAGRNNYLWALQASATCNLLASKNPLGLGSNLQSLAGPQGLFLKNERDATSALTLLTFKYHQII
jgi:hypothetical protein